MERSQKLAKPNICETCDYMCSKLSDLVKHKLTKRHKMKVHLEQNGPEVAKIEFRCKQCDKEYSARNSLWYHEQKCKTKCDPIVQRLLNDNQELRNFIIEQSKTIERVLEHNTDIMSKVVECCKAANNTTINQTNNKAFNINMYLNEDCKNAINFSDFIKGIEITYEDLENNAQLGFVDGMSKIFIDSLNKLEKTKRPLHCTDAKRETMYIKDDGKWVKELDDTKLQKGIQTVSYKSIGKLMEWKKENPDYRDSDSKFSNQCMVMHKNSIAGYDRDTYYPKVIHSIAKEVTVDK